LTEEQKIIVKVSRKNIHYTNMLSEIFTCSEIQLDAKKVVLLVSHH